jgi:flagellar biosynthesis/type III secretory pathway chaperone
MNGPVTALVDHLSVELALAEKLFSILKKEEKSLINNDLSQLEKITSEKTQLISEYLLTREARWKKLSLLDVNLKESEFDKWILSQKNELLHDIWSKLNQVLTDSQQMNRTNGLIIHQLSSKNQRAIAILLGQSESEGLYGSSGQSLSSSNFHKITGY